MTDHAKLSASGSATWLYCPAAPRICAGLPEETSPYAEEGTRAHAQAEAMLRGVEGPHPELGRDVIPYYELVRSLVGQDDTLSIEQQVSFDEWVPGGFGTADTVILHADGTITVVDLKFGQGVKVFAPENPQLRLYALGAVQAHQFTHDITTARMIICQPRMDHVSEETLDVLALLEWGEWVKERAHAAQDPDAVAVPGEKQCRWCTARRICRARAQYIMNVVGSEHLTPTDVARLLPFVAQAEAWAKDIADHARELLAGGVDVPGYKLVEGRSVRKFTEDAPDILRAAGLSDEQIYRQELRTLSDIEKALGGKKKAAPTLEKATAKNPGTPTVVETSDPRPAISANVVAQFPTI